MTTKGRNTILFHPRTLAALKPKATRQDYWDTELPGFGLRITPSGVRTWCARYVIDDDAKGKRLRRFTLGRFPPLKLADARAMADAAIRRAAAGQDAAAEKRQTRERNRKTVSALVESYEKYAASRLRSWPEVRRILNREVLPVWGTRPVSSIRRRDVMELIEAKSHTAPIMAHRIGSRVSALFGFAVDREWIDANPAARIRKLRAEPTRDRVLTPDEIRTLWAALSVSAVPVVKLDKRGRRRPEPLAPVLREAFRVLLWSGQRLGEVCRMRWQDLDLDTGVWTIPAEHVKNKQVHRVPLSTPVLDLIKARQETKKPDAIFVFSTIKGASVAARAKRYASALSRELDIVFHAHDLRRTCATGMAEAGIGRDTIARVLNHRSVVGGITAIYDRHDYLTPMLEALQAWARRLDDIVHKREGGKVLAMAAGRSR